MTTGLKVIVAVVWLMFVLFVWPTPYQYRNIPGSKTVQRINRITQTVECNSGSGLGWENCY